jgi:hypothetical protein
LSEKPCFLTAILIRKLIRKSLQLVDVTCNAPPGSLYRSVVALTVYPEVRIIQTFNKIVPPLITIRAPWLYRKWLIEIVFVTALLV